MDKQYKWAKDFSRHDSKVHLYLIENNKLTHSTLCGDTMIGGVISQYHRNDPEKSCKHCLRLKDKKE